MLRKVPSTRSKTTIDARTWCGARSKPLLQQAGVPIKQVQAMLSHATATLTLDLYARSTSDTENDAAAKMDAEHPDGRSVAVVTGGFRRLPGPAHPRPIPFATPHVSERGRNLRSRSRFLLRKNCAGSGTRTHMGAQRPADFKSAASASSAIPACDP